MDTFAWNGLRVGDVVKMHELAATEPELVTPGIVAFVEVRPLRRGGNNMGIRISTGADRVVWPSRGQVDR